VRARLRMLRHSLLLLLSHAPRKSKKPCKPNPTSSSPHTQFFCSHLTAAAGWCIFAGLCPEEGAGARTRSPRFKYKKHSPPPFCLDQNH
jgi:hypothetical protein